MTVASGQSPLPVLAAGSGEPWESVLVGALAGGNHGIVITRRCVDVVELIALAAAGHGRAALIDAGLPRLDATVCDRLRAASVVPVGVMRRADQRAEDVLRSAGIRHVVPGDASPEVVAGVVLAAIADGVSSGVARSIDTELTYGTTSAAIRPVSAPPPSPEQLAGSGAVVAVWGPAGAPGRSTVASNLAAEFGALGHPALLVDADVYGGVAAAALGILDESAGLAGACRQAAVGSLRPAGLAALCWRLDERLMVLTGITRADRWPEIRPGALTKVLATARSVADVTVVDCAAVLESDEELSYDTAAPRRNGATLAALHEADLIIAVGSADPIGIQRLVRGLEDLVDTGVRAPVWVVLNRVRRSALPGWPTRSGRVAELERAVERFGGRPVAAMLALDQAACDRALAQGAPLASVAPTSQLRRDLAALAVELIGAPVRGRRRRVKSAAG